MAAVYPRLRSLQALARQTLPRAAPLLLDGAGRCTSGNVYVAVDASRSPGKELVIAVVGYCENLEESEAARVVEDRRRRREAAGLPFVLTLVVATETLLASIRVVRMRRDLRQWLATVVPPHHVRVVALAGRRVAMEHAPVDRTTSRALSAANENPSPPSEAE